jgi:hypothetical protein
MSERLEEVKGVVSTWKTILSEEMFPDVMPEEAVLFEWLIQQAEEKQKLEARVEELENLNGVADNTINLIKDKNKRYKQALKYVESELEYAHVTGNEKLCRELIKNSIRFIEQALKGEAE